MLSLRALNHFSVLAAECSYSRAAARLHITQSALSRSIQMLENEVGFRLLDRSQSGMLLTKSGEAVLLRAHRILAEAAALEHESKMIKGLDSGEVSFGVGVFPAASFLSPLLTQLARDYPGFNVQVEIDSWKRLHQMLDTDRLDFVVAITHSLPPSDGFTVRPLPAQHAGLFVRADHPLLALKRSALRSALADYRIAATHLPPRARAQLAATYRIANSDELPMALQCNSVEALRSVALNSDVVLFCMLEAIRQELKSGQLVQLPLSYAAKSALTSGIIHSTRRTLSPAAKCVIALIEEHMAVL